MPINNKEPEEKFLIDSMSWLKFDTKKASTNSKGVAHAKALVRTGKVDRKSDWSFSGDDGNKILGSDKNWSEYAKWFLGKDASQDLETKAYYKYPYGKNGKVYRSGVIAIKQRAAQQKDNAVAQAAATILDMIDKKE